MPDYTFTLDPAASGLPYVVTDRAGLTVDSGTLETDADAVTLEVADLPYGVYSVKASAASAPYASTPAYFATGELVAAGGGADFRTDDVANLVALNVVGDTTSNEVHAVLVADDRYGDLPDWCVDAGGGNWEFGIDAGSITIVGLDVCTIDFSATTASDDPGTINCQVTVKKDGAQITTGQKTIPGDGTDTQVVRGVASDQFSGGTMSILVAAVATDDASVSITDAVTSHDVYLKLTREAYGPEEIA